ncbi:MAG: inverse autotransporter beta domain-containing protein [Hyphomicrobiales bacterium]|nr:inverse autotransporter beta domain-containing protein [Hyphomicrobiales bacterium]
MNTLRFTITAVALMIPLGLAQATTLNSTPDSAQTNPHPPFSIIEGRTLDLRETGSKIVIDTIENALMAGGVELFGEGFRIDSSIGYDFGDYEGIKGDLDAVIPLLHIGRHVLFAQPGAVFWTGIEKEERIDGNFGLVYRNELTKDLVGGVSFFYDQDFQIGHSRISGGIDLQSHALLLGANYYHVLSEVEDGREGFIEEAVDGMDLRMAIEKDIVRAEASVGYWDYTGEESGGQEDPQSGWQTSMGIDFGVRVMPGVFVEAGWEKHKDDLVLDERIFAGLAFRFSLPDLKGASYGDGSMSANLYKIVDREKRILYEERVAGPTVSIVRTGSETIAADEEVTVAVDVQLSEVLAEDVTINLVGSGTATYSGDYTVSVGGTDCTGITEDDCQVTITAGQLSPSGDVEITINDDERTNEPDESIILSMVIVSPENTDLLPRGPFTLTIPEDPPLPAVSISATSTSIAEGGNATLTATLTETVTEDVVINLLEGGAADYGAGMDWQLNNGSDCGTATGTSCQITIMANQRSATATINVNTDTDNETSAETFTVSIDIASPDSTVVVEGSPSSLTFTIPAEIALPTVSLNHSGSKTIANGDNHAASLTIRLSEALTVPITLNLVGMGTATYHETNGWAVVYRVVSAGGSSHTGALFFESDATICNSATGSDCPVMIPGGATIVDVQIITANLSSNQTIIVEVVIPQAAQSLVKAASGDDLSETFTIQ